MQRTLSLFAAGLLVLGGAGIGSNWVVQAQEERPQEPEVLDAREQRPAGTAVSEREANNIRGTLVAATEGALTERRNLEGLLMRLTTPDQARLGDDLDRDIEELDRLITQVREAWRERYDQEFLVRNRTAVYPSQVIRIQRGFDHAVLAREGRGAEEAAEARPAAGVEGDGVQQRVATVIFPAWQDLPEVHVPMVNEGAIRDQWRIDVPLHITGQMVRTNLQQKLQNALEQQDQWPEDVNEAYRLATHLVMSALLEHDRMDGVETDVGMDEPEAEAWPAADEQDVADDAQQ